MKVNDKGFTIAEALLAAAMIAVIIGALAFMFQAAVGGWSAQGSRMGLGVNLNRALVSMERDLHPAVEVASPNANEVRFSADKVNYYIYYLYSPSSGYPPNFTTGVYQIRKTALTGGLAGTFIYGSGDIIARDIEPAPASPISLSGYIVTIDLTAKYGDTSIRQATKVKLRNI